MFIVMPFFRTVSYFLLAVSKLDVSTNPFETEKHIINRKAAQEVLDCKKKGNSSRIKKVIYLFDNAYYTSSICKTAISES